MADRRSAPPVPLPALLKREAEQALAELRAATSALQLPLLDELCASPECGRLMTLLACSSFAGQLCRRHPEWLLDQYQAGLLQAQRPVADWRSLRQALLAGATDIAEVDTRLRNFRNREMLRILWRDFNRLAATAETTADISCLAEACIGAALDFHHDALCAELGTPRGDDGKEGMGTPQRLVVLGMGKLGASELNLSSDVDLIFAYPQGGETDGPKPVHNQEFFTRLGQRLIKSLDAVTADGFVFRVDMRLRPYGDSGALVLSFDAMEEYYQDQGRDWERYAMIKARTVAGDFAAGALLLERLRPFVYRRYVDFSAFDALREMKRMIQREVQRRKLHHNVKLGPGGIREVEFIAQCFQLIRGGRDRQLQERHLQTVLGSLASLGYLPAGAVAELSAAYDFLRDTEHGIQGWLDRQTQELPTAELPRAALAHVMGFADWPSYEAALGAHRERVAHHFQNVIAAPEEERSDAQHAAVAHWRSLWGDRATDVATATAVLREAGHESPEEAARQLLALRSSPLVTRMQTVGRQRLEAFMPQLLAAVTAAERPSEVLLRILPLVEAVVRRTAYLVLIVENPSVLHQLVILCAASPWIATQLARHPVLLDELLDVRDLYRCPPREELQAGLRQQMLRIAWDDLEAQMDQLRYFKQAHVLRIIAAEVTGRLPLMKVSDYLTWLAETILEHVLELAWRNLVDRHGAPRRPDGELCDKSFLVVGYGKLGGIELSHSSDLDLVFIHDGDPNSSTSGPNPIDGGTFFTRLGQRIIHILTAQSALGPLYDVDMRLRPSGNSGLLVTHLNAFRDYQHKQAWTWEHQALVRARPVAGDPELAERFADVRRDVLCKQRDIDQLRRDVVEMREKMRAQLGPKSDEVFDLKHSRGGIVDVEFLVQFCVLAYAGEHAELVGWSDNIRLLEALSNTGILSVEDAGKLTDIYKEYRAVVHGLSLQHSPMRVPYDRYATHAGSVKAIWANFLNG